MTSSKTRVAVTGLVVVCLLVTGVVMAVRSPWDGGQSDEGSAPGLRVEDPAAAGPGLLAGYVRDVNANPVPDARVQAAGTDSVTQADPDGRYELRVPAGDVTVVADHPAHVPQQVALRERPPGGRLDFSLAATEPGAVAPDNAHRLIFWTGCDAVAQLGEEELDRWSSLGVDGFVCSVTRLASMGGPHAFSGDPDADLSGDPYDLQRALRSSAAVRRAKAGELELYLGFYASNAMNNRTPFEEWFNDEAWSSDLLPEVRELAAAVRSLGFAGVAIDQELYPVSDEADPPSWSWDFPGNERPEGEVRAKVRERGRQLMGALLAGYPGLELAAYDTELPETWSARVQEVVNEATDPFESDVRIDLWDGLSSVPGYAAIRWFDAIFYKTPHLTNDWATGLRYNANRIYSLLSRRFSNWSYASSRLHVSPFSWIDEGGSEFEAARSPGYVAAQLAAFSKWGTGGTFANYDYGGLDFNYEPYRESLERASAPGMVDQPPPTLSVGTPAVNDRLELAGTAASDLAIRAVRWYDGRGGFGTAEIEGGETGQGRSWRTRWRLQLPAPRGRTRITIVAEDIKGVATTRTVTVAP